MNPIMLDWVTCNVLTDASQLKTSRCIKIDAFLSIASRYIVKNLTKTYTFPLLDNPLVN